ncbi:PQQ-dependent sugar dehydrogenase [Acinetobacter bereziniae]|uniref:PQQ-dependent sugar dehydrogenase n=1 Tax=Acinetobacter bereziniae TaxID=106648 RepID=UPI00124D0888|nr:PQQ-dependent sugar dehydrogenase [Acinetobacter bereziniae]NUF63904.1 PQQ-dependent sugar dehydrogenase [Acinetobacter bereziniae]NUG07425.1 PQQ-dependent sugar dehydrogenase [Acinetobacter bereziniae]NUG63597.1 PQQ-dependent sugar dehydrogenase [Acinetobacter bereziniae]NUG68438.1 PQQ-dependent sugar dehydrogenase [Acinetobacter bereziniae]NUG81515.1 PQQ-dependent sugar dehydrogenase [Acinetobacter bereziniae]
MEALRQKFFYLPLLMGCTLLSACNAQSNSSSEVKQATESTTAMIDQSYRVEKVATFDEPWAMTELGDGRLLITERRGKLKLYDPSSSQSIDILGVPPVAYGGQGGLGDIALHPDYKNNHQIYLSYAEKGNGGYGAVVVRGELNLQEKNPRIRNIKRIWEQVPKVSGQGHYAHRMLFGKDGKLWISSGERQKFDPAQDMKSNLGKVIRLNDDGSVVADNPFTQQGEIGKQVWSLGHRNPLGIAFDHKDQLWVVEMGPKGGDELNLIHKGENYGYPIVSNGDHYSGKEIPDHVTRPEFKAPEISWTPVISPSNLVFYQKQLFPQWTNKALIGGLSSEAIIVVDTESKPVREIQRLNMKHRIRDIYPAHDGSIWVLEDGKNAGLLRLLPK